MRYNKIKLFILVYLLLIFLLLAKLKAATINSVIISPDPFGPLPATTDISISLSAVDDYADIIYTQDNNIVRRLQNRVAPATSFTDVWNGQDDFSVSCPPGTYDVKVKVTRIATYDLKLPAVPDFIDFDEPRDIACDKNGNVYVLDRGLHTIEKFAPNGTLLLKKTYPVGTGNGQLNNEYGITVDTNFNIYVSDEGAATGRIQKFDSSGNWLATFNAPDATDDNFTGLGYCQNFDELFTAALNTDDVMRVQAGTMALGNQNTRPANWNLTDWAIASDDNDIFGVYGTRIVRWTRASFIANNNPNNNWNTTLADSWGITIRSNLYLYVAGRGAHQIRQHNINTGAALETFGNQGSGDGQFYQPSGIAWDPANDYLWVSDTGNQRLQKISDATGIMQYIDKIESDPTGVINPQDIAIDKYGNLYIVDNGNYCVKKFDKFGNFLMKIGGYGTGNGKFIYPIGVAVDNDGYIYVSDRGTANGDDAEDQIEKFDSNGNFVLAWNHADGRGMMSFVRNGTNFIVAIGQNDGATRDCGMRAYSTSGTIYQSFRNGFNDTDYGDIDRDFLGRFYLVNAAGTAYVDTYPANASGSVNPNPWINIGGTRAGLAIDDFGSLWSPDQASDNVEVRQTYAVGSPNTLLYEFSGIGSGDGQLNNPTYCAIRVLDLPGEWADFWVCDSGNNRVQKFIITWEDEITKQVTIANPGPPFVSAAFPEEPNTNVNKYGASYYARAGSGTSFKITFSQSMDTNYKPTVKFITADGYEYIITQTFYSNNVWIGTNTISTGHDGQATIYVSGAVSSVGSNQSPDPDTSFTFIIDTTPPTLTIYQPSSPTTFTNILVNGNTEPDIWVDIYNFTTTNGWTVFSSNKNILADGSGNFSGYLQLITPKPSTNWISGRAIDKAGNISSWYYPRRKVRCINSGGGSGYVTPSTNKKLGDAGDPNLKFVWTADADMVNGTVVIEVPTGWASPSLTPGTAGYIYISDSSGITFVGAPTNLQISGQKLKLCFTSAVVGGYFEITYGTNNLTMVSNNASIGLNHFTFTALDNDPGFRTNWDLPRIVYPPAGESQDINVIGEPLRAKHSSSMPSLTYKGASGVSVMTLFFTNANVFANDEVTKIVFTTYDSNNISIIPSTAISRISLYTNGSFFYQDTSIETSGDTVTLDLSGNPLPVNASTILPLIVKVDIANNATAGSLKMGVKNDYDITAKDENTQTYVNVISYGGDSFPMWSGYCRIISNSPATKIFTSYIGLSDKYADAGQKDTLALKLVFTSTDSNVNDVQITSIKLKVEDILNSGIVPNTIIDKVTVKNASDGTIYLQDNSIESSGDTIYLDLYAASLYISPVSSVTVNILLDINSSSIVTNFHIGVIDATNITARDKFTLAEVTNYAYSGFSFPMRGPGINIAKYFKIVHDGSAIVSQWEPIIIRVCNANGGIITNYTGTITLDTTGDVNNISWTNNYTFNGTFTDGGSGTDKAYYTFGLADKGIITLSIKDDTIESVNISANDAYISDEDTEGYLYFQGNPEIEVSKTVLQLSARPYENLTYVIQYSNKTPFTAYNFFIVESLPTNLILVTNSAEVSNSPHSGTVTVYYATDWTSTNWFDSNYDTTNTVYSIKRIKWEINDSIGANAAGNLSFKAVIK